MAEEDRSVTTKHSKVAEVTSPCTPELAPWSAEEQKVGFSLINMGHGWAFSLTSNSRRLYAPFLSQKRTGGIKSLLWYRHEAGRNVFGDTRYTFMKYSGEIPNCFGPLQELVHRIQAKRQSKQSWIFSSQNCFITTVNSFIIIYYQLLVPSKVVFI